jgi:hypothetical protein
MGYSRFALAAALALASAPAALCEDAGEVLGRMDAAMTFSECRMVVAFEDAKASGGVRRLGAEVWYANRAGTMIAFTSPPREKGKRILMIGDSMWMSVPGVSKPVRLSGKDAFMGTSFTNDDVMNFDKADDYSASFAGPGDGAAAGASGGWTLELAARKRSLPYQRSRISIGGDYLPTRQELFLLSGELAKTIEFTDPRDFGSKRRPSVMRVTDAMAKGSSTTIRFESIAEGPVDRAKLSPDRFMR